MDIEKTLSDHAKWLSGKGGERANLRWADLHNVDLSKANLSGANLRWANLSNANLSWANLSNADLRWANLSNANLRWANLGGASLRWVNLRWAIGNGAQVKTLLIGEYIINWHADVVWIGCNCRTLTEWETLDESEIPEDDRELWRAHKDWIIETVRRFPAERWGLDEMKKISNPKGIRYTDWAVGEIDAYAKRHAAGESLSKLAAEKGVTNVIMRTAITQVSARKRLADNAKTAGSKRDNLGA